MTTVPDVRGAVMLAEIAEQPAMFARNVHELPPAIREVASFISGAKPRFVLLAARGTSDHAALYAKYLIEIRLGLPVGLASPSTMTQYGARPDLHDVLLVAVSQSGGSPDLVETLTTARACGAMTLAVTNAPTSALATAAALHIDVHAGPELAVAATKSYTAELLALWLLVDAWYGGDAAAAGDLADAAARTLIATTPIDDLVGRLSGVERIVVTGRGYSFPSALETALKLMETSYVSAQAFSGADLMHGPMAMLQENSAVLAFVNGGVGGRAMSPVVDRLRELDTELTVIGEGDLALPTIDESLSPLLEILPMQLLAHRLAVARGYDPDRPRGLLKVTQTT